MKKFIEEFKQFALRGNVVDMAVGVIIGGAFGKIVTSLVEDIIMPVLSILTGAADFSGLKLLLVENGDASVYLNYGSFIQNIVDFLIIALCIFVMVRMMSKLHKKQEEAPVAPAEPSEEVLLLREIRDNLKK